MAENEQLANEELLELYRKIKDGDSQALDELIIRNKGLVTKIASKYKNTPIEHEDRVSIGYEGLIKGVNDFNINKANANFSQYISVSIENEILLVLRALRAKKRQSDQNTISLETPMGTSKNGGYDLRLKDILISNHESSFDVVHREEKTRIVRKVIKKLTLKEQELICLRHGINKTHSHTIKEAARILGISNTTVINQEQKILTKLRHPQNLKQLRELVNE